MTKKILCLIFVLVMSVSLVACGGGNTSDTQTDTQSGGQPAGPTEIVIPDYDAKQDLKLIFWLVLVLSLLSYLQRWSNLQ